jgi:desulfoferrodoxin-like iron-binding protein
MPNLLGKRYRCETCNTEVLCLSGGRGAFTCCDQPMAVVETEPLPSAD